MTNKRMSRVDAEIQKSLAEIISKFDDINISGTLVSIMKVDTTSDFSMVLPISAKVPSKSNTTNFIILSVL